MPGIDEVKQYLSTDTGLAVISTTQADGRVLSSLVNCGVIDHPVTGQPRVAMVSGGLAARLGHVRRGSEVTVAVTRGWNWVGVTGPAELIGPAKHHQTTRPRRHVLKGPRAQPRPTRKSTRRTRLRIELRSNQPFCPGGKNANPTSKPNPEGSEASRSDQDSRRGCRPEVPTSSR